MRRRSECLSATTPARSATWGCCSAALLALPLALAPSGAGAATIAIGSGCTLTGAGVCNATAKLASPGSSGDTIAFVNGGVLALNGIGLIYAQQATLDTSAGNTVNQDGQTTTLTGVVSGSGGNITVTNIDSGSGNPLTAGSITFNTAGSYTGSTVIKSGATLELGSPNTIATSSSVTVYGTLDMSTVGNNTTPTTISGGDPHTNFTIAGGKESPIGATISIRGTTTASRGGVLTGTGGVGIASQAGKLVNNGTVRRFDTVANKTATFTVTCSQSSIGILDIALGGTSASGDYSKLAVTGAATLSGGLDIDAVNGFAIPKGSDTYTSIEIQ
jgi:hypothetical protein